MRHGDLERTRERDLLGSHTRAALPRNPNPQPSPLTAATALCPNTTSFMARTSISSLDSSPQSDDSYDSDEELIRFQEEWEENLKQLQLLVSVVLMPWFGKWLGRRWAHTRTLCSLNFFTASHLPWRKCFAVHARYVRLGLGRSFFLGGSSL